MTEGELHGQPGSDADLARRAAAGDASAFETLARRHQDLMYGVCRRITCNDHDAVDALQEALIIAWRRIGSFEGRSALSTWLYRVAANAAIDEVRKRARSPVPILDVPDSQPGGHDVELIAVTKSAVDWALSQLPPQFRAAVVLREYYDCTYQQIAEVMEVPLDTVKSRISRGRQALADLLLPTCLEEP